jgi:hypothetical protein
LKMTTFLSVIIDIKKMLIYTSILMYVWMEKCWTTQNHWARGLCPSSGNLGN